MIQLTLQHPEKQAKLTALLGEFNDKKAALIALSDELSTLERKQAKNNATIAAVRHEFETEIAKIKAKFETESELTLDDYSATQKLKAELKSRVDFFTALNEDLEQKLYDKREEVYTAKQDFLTFRKQIYRFTAEALIDEFMAQNKAKIALFKGLFVQSGEYNPQTGRDSHDEFNDFIIKKFNVALTTPEELKLPPLALAADWKPKTPTQKHVERFQVQEEKGLKRLLTEM
ncbi:hypothetical protein PHA51_05425 [Rodentibacter pneumotropicus]|uniref:hypothetical protein n=1 Tax=Rodentibacter pneumotropicus TaxID=758 RepID=UPI0023302CDC|nr:hypothetical protein [Rodentibacter pneumotropicus]MDC2825477.1 hypothetical protein [Rodentibacter pneumotropicus]